MENGMKNLNNAGRMANMANGAAMENGSERGCVMVTGGVGFVGSHVVEALLKEGRKVVTYDVFNSETTQSGEKLKNAAVLEKTAQEWACRGAILRIVQGDIGDEDAVTSTVRIHGVTSCIHIAALVDDRRSVNFAEEYIDVNVTGTAKLLGSLGKAGVKTVVQASTRSVFGQRSDPNCPLDENAERRPINPYGASKVAADAMAHCYSYLYGMDMTVIRIFATYGPRGRPDMMPRKLIENIYNDKPIRKFGGGTATRSWIHISDVVSAFLLALKRTNGGYAEYNLGTSEATSLNELISLAEMATGKMAIIEQVPVPTGDAHHVGRPCYDRIRRELGWVPKVTIFQGLKLLYDDLLNGESGTTGDSVP